MIRHMLLGFMVLAALSPAAFAQGSSSAGAGPALPETLQSLAAKGAQIRYLGREKGLDGWIAVHQGQEQYFYATPDREAVLMGLLFDKTGKMLTIRQVQNLQQGNDPTLETLMTGDAAQNVDPLETLQKSLQAEQEKKAASPSEQLFTALENSNWIPLGTNDTAPVVYAFLDPQCPHCHAFMDDIRKNYLDAGLIRLRMIPVGLREETKAQAAFLLASADPAARWYRHLDGDKDALPVDSNTNLQAAEMNLAIMQDWKLDATPILVYRSGKGDIKIIRGRPKTPSDIVLDLQK